VGRRPATQHGGGHRVDDGGSGDRCLLTAVAALHHAYRLIGHPLAARPHSSDLWIAATAVHISASLVTGDGIFYGTPHLDLA